MFDFVHENKKVVQVVLGLIILTFMFWGVESYRSGGGDSVATVDGTGISATEFEQALRAEQERMRDQLGGNAAQLLESPDFRLSVFENLMQQKIFSNQAEKIGLAATTDQLISIIQSISAFQENGKFSNEKYDKLLRGQSMTPVIFEARLKQDIMRQHLLGALANADIASSAQTAHLLKIVDQGREVAEASFIPDGGNRKIEPAAVKAYYDSHVEEFKDPQKVKVQYLVFSMENLLSSIEVTPDEARKYFEEHKTENEKRQASHILISAPKGAPKEKIDEARAKAAAILEELKKNPAKFAELAKKNSQDPGSAQNGGDLGFFGRGQMVKPFEDAVFSLKPGQISDLVQSDFGFHIIRLSAVKGGSFEEARDNVVLDIKRQKAAKKFSESAENFSNMVYEQGDSLKAASEAFKLPIQTSNWMSKDGDPTFPGNPKLLQAIFSDEVLNKKRNTEAVEVSPNMLVSARILEMKPAVTRPLSEVEAAISKKLAMDAAREAALKEGKEALASLQGGKEAKVSFGAAKSLSRKDARTMGEAAAAAIFKADVSKLPVFVGVETARGYSIYRIGKIIDAPEPDAQKIKMVSGQLGQMLAQEELNAYYQSLKKKVDIKIRQDILKKEK